MEYPLGPQLNNQPESPALDILSEQAIFLHDIATLIAELPSTQKAIAENHQYRFLALPYSTPIEIPKALRHLSSAIDELSIGTHYVRPEGDYTDQSAIAYLSVDITIDQDIYAFSRSGEDQEEQVRLYRIATNGYNHSETDDRFSNRVTPTGMITKEEINTLLMSIALPNSLGDYSAYADKDLQTIEAFESLSELLSTKAYTKSESYEFNLPDNMATLTFSKEFDQVTKFTFMYHDDKQQLDKIVEYDIESEFRLGFYSYESSDKQIVIPTADELRFISDLIKKELSKMSMQNVDELQEVIIDTSQADSLKKQEDNEIAAMTEEFLDELGFNPPNTSA